MTETAETLLSERNLSKETETVIMKAIALCSKPYLKPEEAMIYTNLRTQEDLEKIVEEIKTQKAK
jgi:hypothetical protein